MMTKAEQYLGTLLALIKGSATSDTTINGTALQMGCKFITNTVQYKEAVEYMEEARHESKATSRTREEGCR